jgi:hypothetical protein
VVGAGTVFQAILLEIDAVQADPRKGARNLLESLTAVWLPLQPIGIGFGPRSLHDLQYFGGKPFRAISRWNVAAGGRKKWNTLKNKQPN